MSITDQAFIRAYHDHTAQRTRGDSGAIDIGLGSVIPPPHAKFPPMEAVPERAAAAQQTAANRTINSHDEPAIVAAAHGLPAAKIGMNKPHVSLGQSPKASLSSFAGITAATVSAVSAPKPALEIDAVRWPVVCETLLAKAADAFDRLAADLRNEAHAGSKITAISGTDRGEGRTTLALCLAQRLAAADAKIALLDADFSNPHMAWQLGIAIEQGWEAALAGEESLWEVMIESVADRFALGLLGKAAAASAPPVISTSAHSLAINSVATTDVAAVHIVPQAFRMAAVLGELADHFDVVLIDAGPLTRESATLQWLLEPTIGVQNIILAHDVRRSGAHRLATGCLQLAAAKQRQLGIAETFVTSVT